ncbi:FAD-dependent monooxygenase [Actinokineospora cianjurensis]|uniref:3-(3-hydroxy-phenyl)propionate hydroxylase n=1 Tax=Actinokineospora cianjurensis TaxID=585224 RepID=A0A421AWH8_9PSEU|nr:FAD-dependent monooxygenase [Actinokineospora cianjurensis]RLK53984.1 3-(3-hydroxy-phenyl)propionate hydroxylase [Actinokineospora cianjurensis]
MAEVIVAGAGPTGLMLACELRLTGVDVLVLERLAARSGESRAGGLHARSVELLDQRGIVDRFLAAGGTGPFAHFSFLPLDIGDLPTRHPYALAIHQSRVERLLEERAVELGVRLRRSAEVTGLRQDRTGVEVRVVGAAGTEWLRADYLVGCDGGRSAVRKLSGIGFHGSPATLTALLGDVRLADPPPGLVFGAEGRRDRGSFMVFPAEQPGVHRVITMEFDTVADRDAPVTVETLRQACRTIADTDFGMHSPQWISSFTDAARQADRYREGRVLLAGDAAHIHFPSSGQGMNLGIQDAANLGWKLAAVVRGQAPADLLDTYQAERHPAAERMLASTRAQTALWRPGAQTDALREVFGTLIGFEDVNRHLGGACTQLDIRYPLGDGHPALGRRLPDLDLTAPTGRTRAFELLHAARPVLLDLTGLPDLRAAIEGWTDRVDLVEARCDAEHWVYPVIGEVPAPAAVLLRPDGHVAWVAPASRPIASALRAALTAWFGPARDR